MKSTLYIKFIFVYIAFGFLSIFCVSLITSELMMSQIKSKTIETLEKDSSLFAEEYLSDELSDEEIERKIQNLQYITDANVWFVTPDGKTIASSSLKDYVEAPSQIDALALDKDSQSKYIVGTYNEHFEQKMFTITIPIETASATRGYLLLHKPYSSLRAECTALAKPVYITVFVIFILSFSILLAFQFLVYRPLRRITEAAKQYASGNLEYEIPVTTHDEMGYLSASLNYMSAQIQDMDNYQKKFIGNISHDFRSPLTSIKGYLEAMADGTIPVEMQERYFKILLFETERLTDLTSDLLTLNEFDTKILLLNFETFDIHDIIKNTVASFEGSCHQKFISIELALASKPLEVTADKRKIQQVLYNLLDNAIKFSLENSEIKISTFEKGGKVFVSVKDYGMGIPKKSLHQIWDRFYKTDLSRGKDKKGTGLGLSIVKEIIQAHNENINVVSTEGVGTEFIFSLSK